MRRQFGSYYPLALALLVGLAISFIPASSVLGDNVTACQGNGTPSSSLKLGGRTITPTLILQAATGSVCPTGETSLGLVTLSHTIIVSPVVTPTQNGTALLAAMTLIANASPSITNPWLLKLEPGQYDLGLNALTLLPYVDLEGSGEDTTLISSVLGSDVNPPNVGTLIAASNSEVRFIKITNNAGGFTYQVAVSVPPTTTNTSFVHLTAFATASGNGTTSEGLFNGGLSKLENSTLSAGGSASNSHGLFNNTSGTVTVQGSSLAAAGSNLNFGLFNNGTATVENSSLVAAASGSSASYGLFNNGTATVENSSLTASGGASNFSLQNNTGGISHVGTSRLSGTAVNVGTNLVCVWAYNANFAALATNCQ